MEKHKIGDYWKDNWTKEEPWTVQFPNGRIGSVNKIDAIRKSEIAKSFSKSQ